MDAYEMLFDRGQVESLNPSKLVLEGEEVFPFSDYYGALLNAEVLTKNRLDFIHKKDLHHHESKLVTVLLENLFVPNYQTLGGKLNDRIRACLRRLPFGSTELEKIVKDAVQVRKELKRGYMSFQRKSNEEQAQNFIAKSLKYGELMQEFIFRTRPQISQRSYTAQLEQLLLAHHKMMKDFPDNFDSGEFESLLNEFQVDGEEIREASFNYEQKEFHSTKPFVREWKEVERWLMIIKGQKKPIFDGLRLPRFSEGWLKKGLAGAGALTVALYFLPSVRYNCGMTTTAEEVEILADRGEYDKSLDLLEKSDLDKPYWKTRIMLKRFRQEMDDAEGIDGRYTAAEKMMTLKPIDETDLYLKAGFIKIKKNVVDLEAYKTPKDAAISHFVKLFSSGQHELDFQEEKLLKACEGKDTLYVGESGDYVYLLCGDQRVSYWMRKEGDKYNIRGIVLTK